MCNDLLIENGIIIFLRFVEVRWIQSVETDIQSIFYSLKIKTVTQGKNNNFGAWRDNKNYESLVNMVLTESDFFIFD